jgi:hypothetical protein
MNGAGSFVGHMQMLLQLSVEFLISVVTEVERNKVSSVWGVTSFSPLDLYHMLEEHVVLFCQLNIGAACSSETFQHSYEAKWHYIPENIIFVVSAVRN